MNTWFISGWNLTLMYHCWYFFTFRFCSWPVSPFFLHPITCNCGVTVIYFFLGYNSCIIAVPWFDFICLYDEKFRINYTIQYFSIWYFIFTIISFFENFIDFIYPNGATTYLKKHTIIWKYISFITFWKETYLVNSCKRGHNFTKVE